MKSFRLFFLVLFLILPLIQADSGEKRPFLLTVLDLAQEPDRGVFLEEHFSILHSMKVAGISNPALLVALKNRNKKYLFEGKLAWLKGRVVKASDMESLLGWENIDCLIESNHQNLIKIDLQLKFAQNIGMMMTCLDLSDSKIGNP